ncbi:hypothetical protein WJX84_005074 [Apatococcus fuscideae]|uniref:Protein kinase domain-containing protein n=1 Tax=Apatococcus fuscideae TaxID=2026836 RepID=A0AAW1TJI1_9CHLO
MKVGSAQNASTSTAPAHLRIRIMRPRHGLRPCAGPLVIVMLCTASFISAGASISPAQDMHQQQPDSTNQTIGPEKLPPQGSFLDGIMHALHQAGPHCSSAPRCLPPSVPLAPRRFLVKGLSSDRGQQRERSSSQICSLSISASICLALKWCLLVAQQLRGWLRSPSLHAVSSRSPALVAHIHSRHLQQASPSTGGGMSAGGVVLIVGIVVPLAIGTGIVIGLLCWHRKRRWRYISLSNARRVKGDEHKPQHLSSGDPSANGSAGMGQASRSFSPFASNAFSAMADQPWSSGGSRRVSTPGRHHELEMNHVGHYHPGMTRGNSVGLSKQPSHSLWQFGSQELQNDVLVSSNSTGHELKGRSQSSRSLMQKPVGGFVITRSDLNFSRCIGEGSFGRVYLGMWRETTVAIKILFGAGVPKSLPMPLSADEVARASVLSTTREEYPDEVQMHASILERAAQSREVQAAASMQELLVELQREAGMMATLRHPNVVMFLGVCTQPPCVITEFCARGSMLDALQRAHKSQAMAMELDWRKRLSMALDAAKGMHYLHSSQPPIVHRDLKSANLLVDKHWRVKVADFNLSRFMNSSDVVSSVAATNPRWLAPEVLSGDDYGTAADVYSFGVIMWELLMWQIPWEDAGPWQVVLSVVDQSKRPEIPASAENLLGGQPLAWDGYRALMERCWHQTPAKRPGFEAVIASLRALIAKEEQTSADGAPLEVDRTGPSGSSRGQDNAYITWSASQKTPTEGAQASQDLHNFPAVNASIPDSKEEAPLPITAGPLLVMELAGSEPLPLSLSCRPLAERVSAQPYPEPLALIPLQQEPNEQAAPLPQAQTPQPGLPPRRKNRPNPFADAALRAGP